MGSKGIIVAGLGLGALLVAAGACSRASRSEDDTRASGTTAAVSGDVTSCQSLFPDPVSCPDRASDEHPSECATNGDAEPPDGGLFGPATEFGASLLEPFPPEQVAWFGPPFTPRSASGTPTCDTPNPVSSVIIRNRIFSDEYHFRNWTDADACISVFATAKPPFNEGSLQIAAYVGPFDRTDILKNNVAASEPADTSAGQDIHIAFKVPAATNFEIVVIGVPPTLPDGGPVQTEFGRLAIDYLVDVAGCGQMSTDGGTTSDAGASSSGGNETDAGTSSGGNGQTW